MSGSPPNSRRPSALISLLCGGFIFGIAVMRMTRGNYGAITWVQLAAGAVLLGLAAREFLARRRAARQAPAESGGDEDDGPIRSLVFLLSEPRAIEAGAWVSHLSQALGVPLNTEGDKSQNFVLPVPHPVLTPQGDDCFMLKLPQAVFWIFHVKSPYVENLQQWAAGIADKRLREAVEGHAAWISVDLLKWLDGPFDRERVYGVIGKCLAALAGPDVVAVLCPELQRCNEFDPMLLPQLSGGDPLAIFEDPTFAPVLQIKDDDEQMEAAVAEARARWPEFVALFEQRDPKSDRPFIVKAPFSEGENTEFMWMCVTGLSDGCIHGTLANQPHRLETYHEGQQVKVPVDELCDWLCAGPDDQPLGGWSQKVIMRQNRRPHAG